MYLAFHPYYRIYYSIIEGLNSLIVLVEGFMLTVLSYVRDSFWYKWPSPAHIYLPGKTDTSDVHDIRLSVRVRSGITMFGATRIYIQLYKITITTNHISLFKTIKLF